MAWACLALVLGACSGQTDTEPELTLAEASFDTRFQTLLRLGPHRMEATIIRRQRVPEGEPLQADETILMEWQDWDHFHYRRAQAGEVSHEVAVVEGIPFVRDSRGRVRRVDDAEPHRVELRGAWNVWSEAFEGFRDQVEWEPLEDGLVEGRAARRYRVALREDPPGASTPSLELLHLSGFVWVDRATALRLKVDAQGAWKTRPGARARHEVELQMVRSQFGEPQSIERLRNRRKRSRRSRGTAEDDG